MGNRCCFKKKLEPLIDLNTKLNQVVIMKLGNCSICNNKNVEGYDVTSVIEDKYIFVCLECKNLK